MALYRVDALVLRNRSLGEADRILTLLTRTDGKIRAVARGSRRPRNRLVGTSEPLSVGHFLLMSGRELDAVQQAELTGHALRSLREDLDRMAAASVTAELVDLLVEEGDPAEPIYHLTLQAWTALALAGAGRLANVVWWFALHLMDRLGYAPQLERCTACGRDMADAESGRFSAREGGVLCAACAERDPAAPAIGAEARAILRRLRVGDAQAATRMGSSAQAAGQVGRSLRSFVEFRLPAPSKAWQFWDEMGRGAGVAIGPQGLAVPARKPQDGGGRRPAAGTPPGEGA